VLPPPLFSEMPRRPYSRQFPLIVILGRLQEATTPQFPGNMILGNRVTKEGVLKTLVFGTRLSPLQNSCGFLPLYPLLLEVVAESSAATSAEAGFTPSVTRFYSRPWI
jgi:hypothetical protein